MSFQSDALHPGLVDAVKRLIDAGCHYRVDALAALYSPDLVILIVHPDGAVQAFDHAGNLEFFRALGDAGAPPLETRATFNAAQVRDGIGYVVVTRWLDLGAGAHQVVFSLMLEPHEELGWRVFREHAVVVGGA